MTSLFISFGGKDRVKATEIRDRLRAEGYEALFLDFDPADGIPAGVRWERELYVQLRKSDGVIFLASETSVKSRWCFAEVSLARSLGRPVFPVRITEGAWLELLADTQWTDLTDGQAGFARLWRGLEREGLTPADSFSWITTRSPYPGLEPFDGRDAAVFFGRDQEITRLLDLLQPTLRHGAGRFVAIVGPSGSGKSSLLRAGLLPRLPSERWLVLPALLPGREPLRALAHSIAHAFGEFGRQVSADDVADRLPGELAKLGTELREISGRRNVLVVIDQAEELITRSLADEQRAFLTMLRDCLHEDSPLWVIATMRAEFFSSAPDRAGLAEVIDDALMVEPLARERLPEVVERPARRAGLELEAGLVARIVAESTGGDALPLLACTLQQLYERGSDDAVVSVADYEAIGGVVGSLQRQADRVTDELTRRGNGSIVLPTMLKLVRIDHAGEPTSRRVERDTLSAVEQAVVQSFVDARLLVSRGSTVEVAHEALLRQWSPLRRAIDANRADNLIRQELEDAAVAWDRAGRDKSVALRGSGLAAARAWHTTHRDGLSGTASEFLAASTRQHRVTKGIWTGMQAALVVLAVVASGLAVDAAKKRDAAQTARDTAIHNQITAQADQLRGTDASLAAQLDLVAHRMRSTPELRTKLVSTATIPLAGSIRASTEFVRSVALSPDGQILATGSQDRTVRLWNVADRARPTPLSEPLTGATGVVIAVAFSPDGKVLASAGEGAPQLWSLADPARPKPLGSLPGHTSAVAGVAFSPDGRTVATAGEDGTIRLWNVADPARPTAPAAPLTGHAGPVFKVAFSPDGRTLASVGNDKTLRLWNVADPARPAALATPEPGHTGPALSVAFSSDGRTLATGSQDRTVRLWNVADPARPVKLGQLTGHTSFVWSVAFSPDSTMLVSAGYDHKAWLWNITDPAHPTSVGQALTGHTAPVGTVAFGRDGVVATGSHDGTVRLWNVPATVVTGHTRSVSAVTFSRDGRTLASGSQDKTVRLWKVDDPSRPRPLGRALTGFAEAVDTIAFSPDGRVLATGSKDHLVRLWNITDPASPSLLSQLPGHTGYVWSVAFSPDGNTLASGDDKGVVRLWNVSDPAHPVEVSVLTRHTGYVSSVAFSQDGRTLATGSGDTNVQLWDLADLPPKPVGTAQEHTGPIWSVAYSRDGRVLASAGEDGTVRMWNAADRQHLTSSAQPLVKHTDTVYAVAFSPDGSTLVSAGRDAKVLLWNVSDPAHPTSLGPSVGNHTKEVYAATFTPDGRTLATGSLDGTLQLVTIDVDLAVQRICATTRATLTPELWSKYVPQLAYDPPCR